MLKRLFWLASICALGALPLTALNNALRGIMLDGESLWAIGPQLAILAVWGGVSFFLALRWFRWL